MTNRPAFATVHAPVNWWAAHTPQRRALDDGTTQLSFAALAAQVTAKAITLAHSTAPAICWVDAAPGSMAQLVDFLAINASGRVAAVSDPDWPQSVRDQVLGSIGQSAASLDSKEVTADSAFYVGFTSGSSGLPKGFERTHHSWTSSFDVCHETFGITDCTSMLVPGRLSHSLFLFGALWGLWSGIGVRLQERFSARSALDVLRRGEADCMVAVPSQLIGMLELATRRSFPPVKGVRLILIGGAQWARSQTPALQALFPGARIIEFYGASETSFIAWTDSDPALPDSVVGRPFANVAVRIVPLAGSNAAPAPGLIYVRSPMMFTKYVTLKNREDASAVLRDGEWLSVGDVGFFDDQDRLHLLGRQQRMLLTQGKNLFPEEVESVLQAHPAVQMASVQGVPDPLRGMRIVALVNLTAPVSAAALTAWCKLRLEPYKIPRRFYLCDDWPRTISGKTDQTRLKHDVTQDIEHQPALRKL